MILKLPTLLRTLAVLILIAGIGQGLAAVGVMQTLGAGLGQVAAGIQNAASALPNSPRVSINTAALTAFTTGCGYLMLFWGVAASLIAAAVLWALAAALDSLQATRTALMQLARSGQLPRP